MERTVTDPAAPPAVTSMHVGREARIVVLRGPIHEREAEELRRELVAAIDDGVHGLVVDLSEVECLSPTAEELVQSASATLADRGGVLLAWSAKEAVGRPPFVLSELVGGAPVDGASEPGAGT
jgi:anti-anti-sigma regulatory factor